MSLFITPRRVCASGVKLLVLSICCHRRCCCLSLKYLKTGDLEAVTIVKLEGIIEIPRIDVCVPDNDQTYLVFVCPALCCYQ